MTTCGKLSRRLRRATTFACALGVLAIFAPAALANGPYPPKPKGFPCSGVIGPTVVLGNLEVLPGTSCTLAGTKVLGSVYVDATATLQTSANAVVAKDIECDGSSCTLSATDVLHDVEVTTGSFTAAGDVTIWHDLDVEAATTVTANDLTVKSDLTCATTAGCSLSATSVQHDLEVKAGSLDAPAGVTVGHDVEVDNAASLTAMGLTVKNNFTCDTSAACTLDNSTVGQQVEVTRSSNGTFTSNASHIGSLDCDSGLCYLNLDQQTGILPSIVDGSVSVGYNAYLLAGGAQVGGSVGCSICSGIELYDSTIKRNVDIVASSGAIVCNNTISGNVSVSNNRVYFVTCGGNTIGGNLTLQRNRDSLDVLGNVVGQNLLLIANSAVTNLNDNHIRNTLQCVLNYPPPVGAGNTARHIDGQCKPLGVETSTWPWLP